MAERKPRKLNVRQQRVIEKLLRARYGSLTQRVQAAATAKTLSSLPSVVNKNWHEPGITSPEEYPQKLHAKVRKIRQLVDEVTAVITEINDERTAARDKAQDLATQIVEKLEVERDQKLIGVAFADEPELAQSLLDELPTPDRIVKMAADCGLKLSKKDLPEASGIGEYNPVIKKLIGD